jgi:tetratricopeptide (TPR) repeat protein
VAAHDGLHEQIDAASREIAADPTNATLYVKRGELYRLHRAWARAARDYDEALRRDPALSTVHLARGRMLTESGRHSAALIAFDRYIAREGEKPHALVERARVLVALDRPRDAAVDYTRALQLLAEPEPEYYVERAGALDAAGATDEAIRSLDEGVARLGPLVTLELAALSLERKAGLFDAALARVERLADGAPRKESWLVLRGEILARAGRVGEARRAFAAALEAIAALPDHRRSVRAVRDLEARARRGLAGGS